MTFQNSKYLQSTFFVVACIYLYVFMDWLFFATKPSFLSAHPWSIRVVVFFTAAWPFLLMVLLLHAVLCGAAWLLCRSDRFKAAGMVCLRVVPAVIISSLVIMLIDNFTYTAFHWGIVKSDIYTIPIYWVIFLAIFISMFRRKIVRRPMLAWGAMSLVAISLVLAGCSALANTRGPALGGIGRPDKPLPNIIMFASDGVNADHLSAYGYDRSTTPNLDKWLSRALVAENAFTNSGMTSGSLTAMMTGKYPATTKLFYPPQTLQGENAYQHFPGMLRKLGYESLQETVPYYGDALALNWLNSFNYANGRKLHWSGAESIGVPQTSSQFARIVRDRFRDRAKQLLFVEHMNDTYAAVVSEDGAKGHTLGDDGRMAAVYEFIEHARRPFFIHIHLMGTHLSGPHCCVWHGTSTFKPSAGTSPAEQDITNFDNAILHADQYFGQMMDLLRKRHLLDNTIVVYSSDHATGWAFNSRVPLIFIFPKGTEKGRIGSPAQLIDVAPTLLDYLGVETPSWMEGKSLLKDQPSLYRPIFVGYRAQYLGAAAGHAVIGPPTFDLAKEGLIVCNRWYVLSLADHSVAAGKVADFQGKCDPAKLPDAKTAGAMMTRHLEERGFKF